jgi:hypothetical protein
MAESNDSLDQEGVVLAIEEVAPYLAQVEAAKLT